MVIRRPSDYTRFRESLRVHSKFWEFETKDELGVLLTKAEYHIVKIEGVKTIAPVTPKQLTFAWDFLKEKAIQRLIEDYITHVYHKQIILRANRELIIKDKKYRKGQFIPRVPKG